MDTRTRYPLPPVVPEGSPALTDPAHSSATPACEWRTEGDFRDIRYELSTGDATGIAKITINRPQKRNAFRPQTLFELQDAFNRARDDDEVGVIILTGQGDWAFCSGGDQVIRGNDGYIGDDDIARKGIGRLNVLDLQIQIRRTPKPVIAMVAGFLALVALWCAAGAHLARRPLLARALDRWGDAILPVVLIVIGLTILVGGALEG